jgi:hypothetical protein
MVSGEESRSGMWMPKTRSLPSALTASAAVTELSMPPDRATTMPRRFRETTLARMLSAMRSASAAQSRLRTSFENRMSAMVTPV